MKLPEHSMSSVVSERHSVYYGLESWDGVLEWILELNFESRNRKTHFWWYTVRLG